MKIQSGIFNQAAGTSVFTQAIYDGYYGSITGATCSLSGGSLSSPTEYVGYNAQGAFLQSGGTNSTGAAGAIVVGYNSGTYGAYSLSGGSIYAANVYVGYSGTGSFVQSAGTSMIGSLIVAANTNSVGTYNLNGGLLSVSATSANSGTGILSGGAGSLTVDGGTVQLLSGWISSPTQYVGYSGSGSFTQSGGTNTATSILALGTSAGASGTYNLNGGLLVLSGSGLASGAGSAAFNFNGGTLQAGSSWSTSVPITLPSSGYNGTINTNGFNVTLNGPLSGPGGLTKLGAGTLVLTASNTFTGDTTVDGGTLQMPSGSLASPNQYIGYSGTASFLQLGGSNQIGYTLIVGLNPGSSGTYSLSGGSLYGQESLGPYAGIGAFTQSGGTNNSPALMLGEYFFTGGQSMRGSGVYVLSGSGLLLSGEEHIGELTTGFFTQTGGTNMVADILQLTDVYFPGVSNGTYNLNGGLLQLQGCGALSAGGSGATFNFGGGTLGATAAWSSSVAMTLTGSGGNATIDTTGGNICLSGALSGIGGLNKVGVGTLTLTGSDSYFGGTTINGGTLAVGSNLAIGSSTAALAVSAGALDLQGCNVSVGALSGSGAIGNSSTGQVAYLSVGNGDVTSTFSGTLASPGQFVYVTKSGSGALTMTGTNYGYLDVSSGTVQMPGGLGAGAIGDRANMVQSGGTNSFANFGGYVLVVYGSYVLTGSGMMSLTNPYSVENVNAGGAFTHSSGTNSITGSTDSLLIDGTYNLNGGLLQVSSGGISGGGRLNFGGGTLGANAAWSSSVAMTLTGNGGNATIDSTGGNIELDSALSGLGGLAKIGANTLTFGGSNTYYGPTIVNNGVLVAGVAGALSPNSAHAVNGGTLDVSAFPQTVQSLTVAAAGALNLQVGDLLTCAGSASLAGTLNLFGVSGPVELMSYASASGTFGIVNGLPSGDRLVYDPTQLLVAIGGASTNYTLAANASALTTHIGGSATVTATITNTGDTNSDALDYTNLTVTNAAQLSGTWPKAANAAPIPNNGGTDSNSGYFSATVLGTYTFTPSVASASNDTLGGAATLQSTTPVTLQVISGKAQWNVVGSGNWSTDLNWADTEGSGAPGAPGVYGFAGDTATFGNAIGSASATVTLDIPATLAGMTFSNAAGGSYTICDSGASSLTLSNSGSGATIAVIAGSHAINAHVILADNLTVSSSGALVFGGASSMTDNGAGFSLNIAGPGTVALAGSISLAGEMTVGSAGSGSFAQTGGVATLSGSGGLIIGVGQPSQPQSTGSYCLGGGTLSATNEYVGNYNGVGIFTHSGGNNSAAAEFIGAAGSGSYVQTGGTNSASAGLTVGEGGSGTYSLSGNAMTIAAAETIGVFDYGSFAQSGGTNAVGSLSMEITLTGSGAYNLSGGLLTATNEFVGYNGPASFTQSGGTNSVTSLALAQQAGSTGTYSLTGGLLAAHQIILSAGDGVFNFSGGTIAIGGLSSITVPIDLNSPSGTGTVDVDGSSSSVTISAAIYGPGNLAKVGSGLLVLSGTNSYRGGTVVESGELIATNSEALADGSSLYVGSDLSAFGGQFGTVVAAGARSTGFSRSLTNVPAEAGTTNAVPEPGTLALLAAALSGAIVICGRRRP